MTEKKLEEIEEYLNELQEQLNPHNNPSSSLISMVVDQFVIIEGLIEMMGYSVEPLNNERWVIVKK